MSPPSPRPLRPGYLDSLFGLSQGSSEIDDFLVSLPGLSSSRSTTPSTRLGSATSTHLTPSTSSPTTAAPNSSSTPLSAEVKSYSDGTFHNYHALGISLFFAPSASASKSGPSHSPPRRLSRIDIYNPARPSLASGSPSSSTSSSPVSSTSSSLPPSTARRRKPAEPAYTPPAFSITFHLPSKRISLPPQKPGEDATDVDRPDRLEVRKGTTGREFVACFGEPGRKGGGDGWMPVWMEWGGVELVLGAQGREVHPGPQGLSDAEKGLAGGALEPAVKRTNPEEDGDGACSLVDSLARPLALLSHEDPSLGSAISTNTFPTISPKGATSSSASQAPPRLKTVTLGIMVELRDPGSSVVLSEEQKRKGAGGVWDRAAGWTWSSMKLFPVETGGEPRE